MDVRVATALGAAARARGSAIGVAPKDPAGEEDGLTDRFDSFRLRPALSGYGDAQVLRR